MKQNGCATSMDYRQLIITLCKSCKGSSRITYSKKWGKVFTL